MTEFAESSDNLPQSPQAEKLSFWTKLAYGAGDAGSAITSNILGIYSLPFFTNVVGLPPGLAGSILTIGKISDAINDPIIGVLSDRTKTRWGRRLPWMFWSIIPFGIFFFLQWIVPHFSDDRGTNNSWLFVYYVVMGILFNLAFTGVNLPYTALTPELTQDYHERTSLNSFRFAFSIGSSILSLVIALFVFNRDISPQQQYLILGVTSTLLAIAPIFWCIFSLQERGKQAFLDRTQKRRLGFILLFLGTIRLITDLVQFIGNVTSYPLIIDGLNVTFLLIDLTLLLFAATLLLIKPEDHLSVVPLLDNTVKAPETIKFSQQLKIAFSTVPFLYVIGIYLCSWLTIQLIGTIVIYFVMEVIGLSAADATITILLVQMTALLMLFFWQFVSRRVGKQAVYLCGSILLIIALSGLFILGKQEKILLYILATIAGIGISVAYLIPWSMVPDVIEFDELRTGERREGIFYGFMVLLQKMCLALSLFIVGWVLERSGYDVANKIAGIDQPPSAILAIRLGISLIPIIFLVLGLILNHFYPITAAVHQEIRLKLLERKQAKNNTSI
jgi:glycoside/pentoside/hexuronide:cation symporter, GPH family